MKWCIDWRMGECEDIVIIPPIKNLDVRRKQLRMKWCLDWSMGESEDLQCRDHSH